MDPSGRQGYSQDDFAPEDGFEAGIMQLLYGDVAMLENNREQFPGSTSRVPVHDDPRRGLSDHNVFNSDDASHHLPQHINYMQNDELQTWPGKYPRHSPSTQQPAPVSPDHLIDPIAAAAPPLPFEVSSPELVALPPSLEDPAPRASDWSFYDYFTDLSTAQVDSLPRSTVAESSEYPFSRVFPSVYVDDTFHVLETAAVPPPVTSPTGSTVAEASEIPAERTFSRVFPPTLVDSVSQVLSGTKITAPDAQLPAEVAGVTSAAPEQTVNMSAGASKSSGKGAPPPAEDRKRKGIVIEEVEDDTEVRKCANTKHQATQPPKPKRTRAMEMHNMAERRRRVRSNEQLDTLFALTPDSQKGSRIKKDDRKVKVIDHMRALIHENENFRVRYQHRQAPPYGMMVQTPYGIQTLTPYNYMRPYVMTTPPPPFVAGPSVGPTFPTQMYPLAAAGSRMSFYTFRAPMYPPAAMGPSMRPIFPTPMYQLAVAGGLNVGPTFPVVVPMYRAIAPVPVPADLQAAVILREEYQQLQAGSRQMQHLAPAQAQDHVAEPAGNPGNHQTG